MEIMSVVDADGHITESESQVRSYLSDAYGGRKRAGMQDPRLFPREVWSRNVGGRTGSSAPDAETWLRAMDEARMETAVLFPTAGLSVRKILEAECADAVCRAYNDFFADKFHRVSPRLKGAAVIPFQDVSLAVQELKRAVTELGAVTALLCAGHAASSGARGV